jgi:hypothetical protein
MRLRDSTLTLTKNERKVRDLLCSGKSQSDVADELKFSRAYINQIVKKLLSFEAIKPENTKPVQDGRRKYERYYIRTDILTNYEESFILSPRNNCEGTEPKFLERPKTSRCLHCKRKIRSKTHKYQKFCSRSCSGKYHSGPRSSAWQGGKTYEPYCYKFNEDLKERVRDFFERECFMCGAGEVEKSHAVHHIEYNKMACCDGNNEALLVPLCENCHNKTTPMKDRTFWEKILYHQLMQRTGGKCFLTHKEVLIIEQKQKRGEQN